MTSDINSKFLESTLCLKLKKLLEDKNILQIITADTVEISFYRN